MGPFSDQVSYKEMPSCTDVTGMHAQEFKNRDAEGCMMRKLRPEMLSPQKTILILNHGSQYRLKPAGFHKN
jgi:hypothetical protein